MTTILNELFNSETRVRILSLLFRDEAAHYYVQQITKLTRSDVANVHRELRKLDRLGVIGRTVVGNRTYYSLDAASPAYAGLKLLFANEGVRSSSAASPTIMLPMQRGIPERVAALTRNREWYHQRFDGSPLFIGAIAEAEVMREDRKPAGTEADVRICFFSEGRADWYLDMADVRRGAAAVVEQARKDPSASKKILGAWRRDEEAFDRFFSEEFPSIVLRELGTDALRRLWERYWRLAIRRLTSSSVIDHFALGTDEMIRNLLRKEVFARRAGKSLKESEFTGIFAAATAPVHLSFINQAEIDLLKIAVGLSHETLEEYRKCYFWISNNYVRAETLPVAHFKNEIRAWKLSGKNLRDEMRKITETPHQNKAKKRSLFRRFSFSSELRTLITVSEDFSWWQDERKKATYFNIHIGSAILREIARRRKYVAEDLKYCVASEIVLLIDGRGPTPRELRDRRRSCMYVATRDGFFLERGKRVEELRRAMLGETDLKDVQDIRGLSACLGRAVGTVKVVGSATEIGKVQKGDVLVAVMTRPDYVPAMRKAVAVVTNEGGVTSHAAIVSRELGIPCIIGTKIATQVFKDGDVVEVNANHGWVRKVQQ